MKRLIVLASALLMLGALPVAAQTSGASDVAPGQLIKTAHSSAVYFIDSDLTRHAFPNEHVFRSWYKDFDGVVTVDDQTLSEFPLAGLVPYKAAARLVKLQTDPKVYAVDDGGVLRWVKTEALARALFGDDWNQLVDDLPDSFFAGYSVGDTIDNTESYRSNPGLHLKNILATLRAKRLRALERSHASEDDRLHAGYGLDREAVCHKAGTSDEQTIYIAHPAVAAHLRHGDTEGACADGNAEDATAPVISGAEIVDVSDTTATVDLSTDEDTTVTVYFSTVTPVDLSSSETAVSAAAGTEHSVLLEGLEPETTYHAVIEAMDAAGNISTTDELTFTTEAAPEEADAEPPAISDVTVTDITDSVATVSFTTDEDASVVVYYSTVSPVDSATTDSIEQTTLAASHSIALTGLLSDTQYYVVIVATDADDNAMVSDELSFTTEPVPADTVAPTIDGLTIDTITDTAAAVHVATDEDTTATAYVSATSPVDTETAENVEDATLAASHDLELTGLSAETTYYVVVRVTDEAGNDRVAEEASFTTEATPAE